MCRIFFFFYWIPCAARTDVGGIPCGGVVGLLERTVVHMWTWRSAMWLHSRPIRRIGLICKPVGVFFLV